MARDRKGAGLDVFYDVDELTENALEVPFDKRGKPLSLDPKQVRTRARRKQDRAEKTGKAVKAKDFHPSELQVMGIFKPVEEWDAEELARGRTKNPDGSWPRGPKPRWITREIEEKSLELFKNGIRASMREDAAHAVKVLRNLLDSDEQDEKGKPTVPASVKKDIAFFLVEHLIGKPKQETEVDVNVKLQGILANVMVQPAQAGSTQYVPSHKVIEGNEDDAEEGEIVDG